MEMMYIRKTKINELDAVMDIYSSARSFMRKNGNHSQWDNNYPGRGLIESDIYGGKSYVLIRNDEISAVFYFALEDDPTYRRINGSWLNDKPYGVVHRIARTHSVLYAGAKAAGSKETGEKSTGAFCLDWCYEQHHNIKIDTHKDNAPMRALLERTGFTYCGIIWLANGDERLAFQKAGLPPG